MRLLQSQNFGTDERAPSAETNRSQLKPTKKNELPLLLFRLTSGSCETTTQEPKPQHTHALGWRACRCKAGFPLAPPLPPHRSRTPIPAARHTSPTQGLSLSPILAAFHRIPRNLTATKTKRDDGEQDGKSLGKCHDEKTSACAC